MHGAVLTRTLLLASALACPRALLLPASFASFASFASSSMMGNAAGKPFGEAAARVLSRPAEAPGGAKQLATFAAGCFWGVELAFQRVPGVLATQVGYTGGHKESPTYREVCSGTTGHTEAVQVEFDADAVSYDELLTVFWDRLNPTTLNQQGNDIGTQYRSGIFYHNEEQHRAAQESKEREQSKYSLPIVTEITPAAKFYAAEDYHQQYLEKGGQCAAKGDTSAIRCYG